MNKRILFSTVLASYYKNIICVLGVKIFVVCVFLLNGRLNVYDTLIVMAFITNLLSLSITSLHFVQKIEIVILFPSKQIPYI